MTAQSITFIGAGNMASSLIGGLINAGREAQSIHVSDPNSDKWQALVDDYGIIGGSNNQQMAKNADMIVLAVKPSAMQSATTSVRMLVKGEQPLFISIAAGIPIAAIAHWLEAPSPAIVRCMPNTPALVGQGATGLYANNNVTEAQKKAAQAILAAVGSTVWLQTEEELDIVTALSGSGPAYFFLVIEAMIAAGQQMGLAHQTAQQLAVQTALGAATMAKQSHTPVEQLRAQVTSRGGTTEQAIRVLEDGQLRTLFKQAMAAAQQRAKELGKGVTHG